MNRFSYLRAANVGEAVRAVAADPNARFIAGGTNLVDLMKYNVERPTRLVDITRLPFRSIEDNPDGGLTIGSLVTNTDAAYDERIERRYPLLSSAIVAGASAQLRNAATMGGNLLQRTRCYYFYDAATPCNKRQPGTGCPAQTGVNRIHAILGTSRDCIATHPSVDMCVALAALGARVRVEGPNGGRVIPFVDFHRLPGDTPDIDTNLRQDEIITAIELPAEGFSTNYTYLKLRDRLSYAFALVSVAVGLRMDGDRIAEARIALGGVAHKPWRDTGAEDLLRGGAASAATFQAAADRILAEARGFAHNAFKIDLARKAIVRALGQAAAGTPQSQTDKHIRCRRARARDGQGDGATQRLIAADGAGPGRLLDRGLLRNRRAGGLRHGARKAVRPRPQDGRLAPRQCEPRPRRVRGRAHRHGLRSVAVGDGRAGYARRRRRSHRGRGNREPEHAERDALLRLHPRGGVRRGEGRRGARRHPGDPDRRRGRGRQDPEPEDRAQPDHRRRGLRYRHGASRGVPGRPPARPLHEPQFAEYHIPANADVHDIDVIFVEEHDEKASPIGVKGLGEIGIVGTAAAIANAVFHATGKRIRILPITIDKLLG